MRYTPPIYRAETLLKIEFQSPTNFINLDIKGLEDGSFKNNKIEEEIEIITSDVIFLRVIDTLGLQISIFQEKELLNEELFKKAPFQIKAQNVDKKIFDKNISLTWLDMTSFQLSFEWEGEDIAIKGVASQPLSLAIGTFLIEKTIFFDENDIEKEYYFSLNSEKYLFEYLKDGLVVRPDNIKANTLQISFEDQNLDKALSIVTTLKEEYFENKVQNQQKVYQQSLQFLAEQLISTTDSLNYYEKKLTQYLESSDEGFLEMLRQVTDPVQKLRKEKRELSFSKKNYEKIYHYLQNDSDILKTAAFAIVNGDEELKDVIYMIRQKSKEWDRIKKYYTPKTHAQQQKYEELDLLKKEASYMADVQKQIFTFAIQSLNTEIYDIKTLLKKKKIQNTEYKSIYRYYSIYENITGAIISKVINIGIIKASITPNFQVLSPPKVEEEPIYPKPMRVYLFSCFTTLLTLCVFVFIKYMREDNINSIHELEEATKVPLISILPEISTSKYNFAVMDAPKSAFSEALRALRTNIELMNITKKKWTISLTSSVPGEGKTFISSNLAAIIALMQKNVILVDMDMRKPQVHKFFQNNNKKGVSTLLIGKHPLEECIKKSHIPFLSYICSGPVSPNPSEMIMSDAFDRFLKQLEERYEVIILDTPPAGLVTDAILLMKKINFPLFVVRSGYSKYGFGKNIDKIKEMYQLQQLSVVLNGLNKNRSYGEKMSFQYNYGDSYYEE